MVSKERFMTRYFLLSCFVLVVLFFSAATPAQAADTIFIVTDTTDMQDENPGDGICETRKKNCSLRAAIQESNAFCGGNYYCEETIELPAGTFKLTLNGAEDNALYGDLDIKGTVTIQGAGVGDTIIDGNAADRIFQLIGDPLVSHSVHLESLTLTNGKNKRGGAIYNQGMSLYFTDSEARNNISTFWGGGAIYNDGGLLVVTSSFFSQNIAQGDYGFGGAIYNEAADLIVSTTALTENSAAGFWSYGGAIHSMSGNALVGESLIYNNSSTRYGGGVYLSNGWLSISKSYVQDNYAATAGGGIMADGSTATFILANSTVTGNMADINVGEGGGGLYLTTGSAEISDSTIADNSAMIGGGLFHAGGELLISRTTIRENVAVPDGGGIYHDFGTIILNQSTISDNQAARGAGLFSQNGGYSHTTYILVNSTVSGNIASIDGGGIYNDGGDVELYSTTIANNQADGDKDTRGAGGGIFNETGDVHLQNTILADNFHPDGSSNIPDDCFGHVKSNGYNLIESDSACMINGDPTGNIVGEDPQLGPLQDNSGPTHTHSIPQGSKAVDTANPTDCLDHKDALLEKDQRGFERHVDGDGDGTNRCDIGAFEYK
jgi:CSLREA domain-containing protein